MTAENDAWSFLDNRINNEATGRATRMNTDGISHLLDLLGKPHHSFPAIHIAGTNGKGSTAFFLNTLFQNTGKHTGLYTSPHLVSIHERIRIDGNPVDDKLFESALVSIESCIHENNLPDSSLTWFDIVTTAAFWIFAHKGMEIAVIETGLGGRLDSTNVIVPSVSVLTPVSLDHQETLGDSINKITAEKCGIVKEGVPVVTSQHNPQALSVIQEHADRMNCRLYQSGKDFQWDVEQGILKYQDHIKNASYEATVQVSRYPAYQHENIALAMASARVHGLPLENPLVFLQEVVIPGRWEYLLEDPLALFDAAHNGDGIEATIQELQTRSLQPVVIVAFMKDRYLPEIIDRISTVSKQLVYVNLDDPRAFHAPSVNSGFDFVTGDSRELARWLKNQQPTVFLFTGSFRLYKFALETTVYLKKK